MIHVWSLATVLVWITACTQIPTKELTQYKEAFSQAQAASESVLIDLDQAKKAAVRKRMQEERKRAASQSEPRLPFPTNYAAFKEQVAETPFDEIEQRRKALEVIAAYNDVLTQLAEGKSVEFFGESTGALVTTLGQFASAAAGSAVPGLSALSGLATTAAKEIEKARLRKEFEKAIANGAPLVQGILQVFINTLEAHYALRETEARDRGLTIVRNVSRQVRTLRTLTESHAPAPPKFMSAAKVEKKVNNVLLDMSGGLTDYPYTFAPGPATNDPYKTLVKTQVDSAIRNLERLAGEYRQNNNQMAALGAALVKYEALLVQTRVALMGLVEAMEAPPNLPVLAADIKALAFDVNRNIEEFRLAVTTFE
ncbi:MAG: hypothetical protein V3T60_11130 [Candidatus Binatia bacterium]